MSTEMLVGVQFSSPATTVLIVVTVIFILLGVFGNALIIVSVVVDKKLRNRCNVFVVTLALADLAIQGYILPFTLADFIQGHYPVGMTHCRINAFVVSYCYGVSLWSIAFMAFNRFVKICRPMSYDVWFSKRNTIIVVFVLFLIPIWTNIAPYLGFGLIGYDGFLHLCHYLRTGGLAYAMVQMLVSVVMPTSVVFVCYSKIFLKVRSVSRTVNKGLQDQAAKKYNRRDVTVAYSLFAVFVVLVGLLSPFAITSIADVKGEWPPGLHVATVFLAHTNSWVNWIIYGVMNVNFRRTYTRILLRRNLTLNSVNTATVGNTVTTM